jgi:hypothetical protein
MAWVKEKKQADKHALLKGRIDLACEEAAAFIEAQVAAIKEHDGFNQPLGAIRNMLTRGDDCLCRVTRRLLNGD